MSNERPLLTLLTVHAHPDDESSKGAATVAKYHSQGIKTVLVCCTGGEEGDILNPALDNDEVRANLPAIRREELTKAASIIGYDDVELLGYADSGMAGTPANQNPACFARADATEAVGKLVRLFRLHRPDVVVTYDDEQEIYPHPDHLRVHDVSIAAYVAAADAAAYPDLGEPWQVKKLYYSVLQVKKLRMMHEELLRLNEDSPFPEDWDAIPDNEATVTTRVDIADWSNVTRDALLAHATQIDPESPLWFTVLPAVEARLGLMDEYVLARSVVESDEQSGDLFDGVRKK